MQVLNAFGSARRSIHRFLLAGFLIAAVVNPLAANAEAIQVQVKSFIAAVDLTDQTQFDSANSCSEKFNAFAVNCTLWGGEDPADGEVDSGQFRLWSQVLVDAQCTGNKVTKWKISGLSTSFGKEAFFQTSGNVSKPLSVSPSPGSSAAADRVEFGYRVRGQPLPPVNTALAAARARTCTFIWHEVSGSLSCVGGNPVVKATVKGSGFPSHRAWVDGNKTSDLPQGAFKKLWDCDPIDPTSVR
ncbi:hypothetical protein [Bradyrhizobium sp.]